MIHYHQVIQSDTEGGKKMVVKEAEQTITTRACGECGYTGAGLIPTYNYIGGQGYVRGYECHACREARWIASKQAVEALNRAMRELE